jgi:hypothetical protein
MSETVLIITMFTCGVISAKWAMELGFCQFRQVLFLIAGFFLGPLVLLVLYICQVNQAHKLGEPGGRMV